MGGHPAEIVQCAAEIFLVGEHRKRVGARRLVALRLFHGRRSGLDLAGGGRAAFDLGDDGELAVVAAQRGGD